MNCKNCGAPLKLYRERDYYECEYCGTYLFPKESAAGIRVLGENLDGVDCPVCLVPVQMVTLDDAHRGYQCPQCQGLLLARGAFRTAVETRRAKALTPPKPMTKLNQAELNRRLNCSVCHQTMETHPYMGPGNIVIDTCSTCNLIWLDYGELGRVVDAPGRDRGPQAVDRGDELWPQKHPKSSKKKKKKSKKSKMKKIGGLFDLEDVIDLIEDIF